MNSAEEDANGASWTGSSKDVVDDIFVSQQTEQMLQRHSRRELALL
ncbi:MAG: hypothetical protein ACJ8F7_06245 [Gemmataceae bacterium]